MVDGRPAFAGFRGRVAMRGRHAAELSHALARIMRAAAVTARERRRQQLERQLATCDAGRRLGGHPHAARRPRAASSTPPSGAAAASRHGAAGKRRGAADSLSPLAVLGRAAMRSPGTRTRPSCCATPRRWSRPATRSTLTLSQGELDCEVGPPLIQHQGHQGHRARLKRYMPETSIKDFERGDRRARNDRQEARGRRPRARAVAGALRARRPALALLPRATRAGGAPHRDPQRAR